MSKTSGYVCMNFMGNSFDPYNDAKNIDIEPFSVWKRGDQIHKTKLTHKQDGWQYRLDRTELDDLESILIELLDVVEPHKNYILDVVRKSSIEIEISFAVYIVADAPACWFSPTTLKRVTALGASIDIDLIMTGEEKSAITLEP